MLALVLNLIHTQRTAWYTVLASLISLKQYSRYHGEIVFIPTQHMSSSTHQIFQCVRQACRFRFPIGDDMARADTCPHCGAPARLAVHFPSHDLEQRGEVMAGPVEVGAMLDNIRSVYNVGSMLRTADGAGLCHVHLCGITTTPDHPRVKKTALGAELAIPWTYHRNGVDAALSLKNKGARLWAIENSSQALPLFQASARTGGSPIIMVVGNEVCGIDPGVLELCEQVFWIPMHGQKSSLNVAVAFGIGAYYLLYTTAIRTNMTNSSLAEEG